MAVDYFLKIDGIVGESQDAKHPGEIDLMSFSWGASHPVTTAFGGGGGAGRVQMQDFHFTKTVDKTSPNLFLKLASGAHIVSAVLTGVRAGGDRFQFLKITLSDVLVSSYAVNGDGQSGLPTDQFSLNFGKIEFSYTPQNANGTAGAPVTAGWDLKANRAV